jgi:hypothetical protein
LLSRQRILHLG